MTEQGESPASVPCPECVNRGYTSIACKLCQGSGFIDPLHPLRGKVS